jgi:glycosyltransferase involved in cell wall biosynthesis
MSSNNITSIIIPARNEPYLDKTINDLFGKATGKIEVIAILDGYWPDPPLRNRKNLVIVHMGEVAGMRSNINSAARIATGKYLMKIDAHCMVGKGFDEILKADCEEGWLVVPSRYSLNPEKWKRVREVVNYLTLTFPYDYGNIYGTGLHGKGWKDIAGSLRGFNRERKEILIDDIITFQGSCWFMHTHSFFDKIGCLDTDRYNFNQEAQELGFKFWLSGGRVIRNKKTWYAHLKKGSWVGTMFRKSKREQLLAEVYSTDFWMNNKWPGQKRDMKWLIDKFWPLEGWPDDWQDPKYSENWEHVNKLKEKGEKREWI